MRSEENKSKIFIALLLLVIFFLTAINIYTFVKVQSFLKVRKTTINKDDGKTIFKCALSTSSETAVETGIIRKEKDTRDPGSEYMYIFYFDKPFLLWTNSSGSAIFVDSIEVYGLKTGVYAGKIDDYVGKHVEIAGVLEWVEESRIINIQAIRVIGSK